MHKVTIDEAARVCRVKRAFQFSATILSSFAR